MSSFKLSSVTAILATMMFCLFATHGTAQVQWQLKKNEDGIKVYTGNTPNSNFKSIKVECTVNATLSQLVAFLLDVTKQKDWVYCSKDCRLVKRVAPNEIVYYSQLEVPWPATDRDYISHIVITQNTPHALVIEANTEPDQLPQTPGAVRVKKSQARWEVTAISKDQLKILYTVSFDPAGSLPAWLVNMFVTKGPYLTFQKLREVANKPEYKNAHVDFIKD
ncbi:MAG: lipid-binding protein [Flavipsychrobacter sp.]|jgi:hypothetical protein|nr:lipid-binding protein [Flavipsychrobacter sp.]